MAERIVSFPCHHRRRSDNTQRLEYISIGQASSLISHLPLLSENTFSWHSQRPRVVQIGMKLWMQRSMAMFVESPKGVDSVCHGLTRWQSTPNVVVRGVQSATGRVRLYRLPTCPYLSITMVHSVH